MRHYTIKICALLMTFIVGVSIYFLMPRSDSPLEVVKGVLVPCRQLNLFEQMQNENADVESKPCDSLMVFERGAHQPDINKPIIRVAGFDPYLIEIGCVTPLTVTLSSDRTLYLTGVGEFGNMSDVNEQEGRPALNTLRDKLRGFFDERIKSRAFIEGLTTREDLPMSERIVASVVVEFPCSLSYSEALDVVDAIKASGANQIALQVSKCNP
jgi:hypothetical protein